MIFPRIRSLPTHFWYWRVPHIPTPPLPARFGPLPLGLGSIVVEEREDGLHLVDLAPEAIDAWSHIGPSHDEALGSESPNKAHGDMPSPPPLPYTPDPLPSHMVNLAKALKRRKP